MTDKDYQPGALGDATVRTEAGRHVLVFVRELAHPPERVWRALTERAELAQWAPFDPDRNLDRAGALALSMAGAPEPEPLAATVRRAEAPRLLEYTWGDDVLRWELEPLGSGTRLTLLHTTSDPSWLSKVAAGWHICLDVAERMMNGSPVGRIVAEEAMRHGWERLDREYAERFGLPTSK